MADTAATKTTKALRDVVTIADIEALEARPYDEIIPARTLIDLLRATASLHPDRPAITIPAGVFSGPSSTISHRDFYRRTVRAANLFHGLLGAEGGTVAFLGPIVEGMMEALLGAQTAGVASTINYLLSAEVIADLLAGRCGRSVFSGGCRRGHLAKGAGRRHARGHVEDGRGAWTSGRHGRSMIEFSKRPAGTATKHWSSSRDRPGKPSARFSIPAGRRDGPSSCA